MKINPYLMFNGNCEEAFEFYERCLGTKIGMMMLHRGSPAEASTRADWLDKVLHANMMVGDVALMGSDVPPEHYHKPQGITVSIAVATPEEAERLFAALSEGATITMPLGEQFWALRFGMLTDRFGIPWMINCERPR
jgi:PhnB protein